MRIREIDDRYPEFAEPYEPVKGGKHHKPLSFPVAKVLAAVGAILLLTSALVPGPKLPGLPVVPPVTEPPVTFEVPVSEPPVTDPPVTQPPVTEPPVTQPPVTDPPVTQPPVTDPPVTRPPVTAPPVTAPPVTAPPVTAPPVTAPPVTAPPVTAPPVTPEPSPIVPKGPSVTLSYINYWHQIGHAELAYEITANDATSITSSSVVTSVRNPSMHFSTDERSGDGEITINRDVSDEMEYNSADGWTVDVTLNYTLDGEEKTETVTLTGTPELQGDLRLYNYSINRGELDGEVLLIESDLSFLYPADYRHSFSPKFTRVTAGWMDKSRNKILPEETVTLWEYDSEYPDDYPFTGGDSPVDDGADKVLQYHFSGDMPYWIPETDDGGQPAYFYLIFEMEGSATDTLDGSSYPILDPSFSQSNPIFIGAPYAYLWDLTYWGDFNSRTGLCHLEAQYYVDPGAADPGSVVTNLKLTSEVDNSRFVTKNGVTALYDLTANWDVYGTLFYNSVERWTAEIEVNYTVDGVPMTEHFGEVSLSPYDSYSVRASCSYDPDKHNANISFIASAYDRHSYSFSFEKAEFVWLKNTDGIYEPVGEPVVIWTPDSASYNPFEGPFGPTVEGAEKITSYNFQSPGIDNMIAPDGATHYYLRFTVSASGTDTDGTVYPYHGGIPEVASSEVPIP